MILDPMRKKRRMVRLMVKDALQEIQGLYGTGNGDGDFPLFYHNVNHTVAALRAAELIADLALKAGKISINERVIIPLGIAFHDAEQNLGPGRNERYSADIADMAMIAARVFEDAEIEKVRSMVLATRCSFIDGVIRQSATKDYTTQIVADADLATLGQESEIFWQNSLNLLKENTRTTDPTSEALLAFAKKQAVLLQNHEFYTPEAGLLFPHKAVNLLFVQDIIRGLEK